MDNVKEEKKQMSLKSKEDKDMIIIDKNEKQEKLSGLENIENSKEEKNISKINNEKNEKIDKYENISIKKELILPNKKTDTEQNFNIQKIEKGINKF